MTTIEHVVAVLDGLNDDFTVLTSRGAAPDESAIAAVESALGTTLAPGHRELIRRLGYLAAFAKESAWPRPREWEVRPLWQHNFGIELFGVAPAVPERLDVVAQTRQHVPSQGPPLVAMMRKTGDRWVVGYDAEHVLWTWQSDAPAERMPAGDPLALLGEWLSALVADTLRIKAEPPSLPERGDKPPPDLDDILARLRSEDLSDREDAVSDLGDLADNPPPAAVDALIATLEDEFLRGHAADVLELYADPRALDALLAALEREKTHERWQYRGIFESICTAIGVCGDEDPRAVEALAEHLIIDGHYYAALYAFKALERLGPRAVAAITALRRCVSQGNAWQAAHGHATLYAIDHDAAAHIPPLVEALSHSDSSVQAAASLALEDIGALALPYLDRAAAEDAAVAAHARRLAARMRS
jgi:HEAT repeat protein